MPETQNAPLHDHLAGLNPEQRAAAAHGAGPLLVIAGAGSGKTATLAHRVAHLIAGGADPRRILLMTFSRRAAAEMTARAGRIVRASLGERGAALAEGLVWAGTFHAMGARLLREVGPAVGLDPGFSLHDREDSADLMNLVRHELGLATSERRFPGKGTCLAIYSRAVNGRTAVGDVVKAQFPWCAGWEAELRRLFAAYVAAKQAQGVLDYDDLLLWWAEAAAEPGLAAEMGGRFDHVLVDEYQDTNRLQAEILMRLKPDGAGVTVVGDDCQSIYAFRAAEVRNILDFPGAFAPRAAVVTLERNYRSVAPILAASDAVIAEARERFAKVLRAERGGGARPRLVALRDEGAQAAYVCERVLAAREEGAALKAQAVLFRAAHHAAPLEVELTRRGVPFVKFGGLKFLEARHVKDMLALLRFAENPRDRVAGFRALLLVPGVGPVGAAEALDALGRGAGLAAPRRAGADWAAFAAAFATLRRGEAGWPGDVAAARAWYEPQLERLHEDAAARRADLAALEQIAATYPSRERFLTELTLDPPDATSAHAGAPLKDEDYLILSTIHSAKGQEWSQVFVLNCIDGCIPSDLGTGTAAEVEEERRLLYVAMTRAKDALHLVTPQRFFVHGQAARGDRHVYAMRSRFLPDHLLGHFEQTAWPLAAAAPAAQAPHVAVDLRGRMRGMWEAG